MRVFILGLLGCAGGASGGRAWAGRLGVALSLLALHGLPGTAGAQVVVGRVVAVETGAGVIEADVRLVNARGGAVARAVTDSAGRFQVAVQAAGRYAVRVEHLAHEAFTSAELDLEPRETVEVEIRLGRGAIPLEPLLVTARSSTAGRLSAYHDRLATLPAARFVTRADIEKRPTAAVSDLLRSMAGVHVVPVKRGGNPLGMTTHVILMRGVGTEPPPTGADEILTGMCSPALLLDGVKIQQSSSFPVDDLLSPITLEGIEVYTTAGDAPVELRTAGTCGVVALWTRTAGGEGGRRGWKRHAIGAASLGALLVVILSAGR